MGVKIRLSVLPLCFVPTTVCYTNRDAFVTTSCCNSLQSVLGSKVSYPGNNAYNASLISYWSQQEEQVEPGCIVSPQNSQDVAAAIHVLGSKLSAIPSFPQCQFAIRGGGHTPWAGSANINNGVTIDLSAMNIVTIHPSRTIVSAGPGNRWIDLYSQLDPLGLSVSGGRISDIGVAGLTTGGGMSYFAPRFGFVCDNVENFEVVLANGSIVDANSSLNQDLWFALKGGSNNFGIVTRFDFKVFPQGDVWGGNIFNPIETRQKQIQAFYSFNAAPDYDEYASLINSYGYSAAAGGLVVANTLVYTKPEAYPKTFAPQTDIQPQILNTMAIANLSTIVTNEGRFQPSGQRQLFITRTFETDVDLLNIAFDNFNASLPGIVTAEGIMSTLVFQALPTAITNRSLATGGNPLGLEQSREPLVLMLISAQWSSALDDDRINAAVKTVFAQTDDYASRNNLTNRWIYLNYAAGFQDPIAGYGPRNKARLQAISRVYDPEGLFQKGVPGGYKLFSASKASL